MYFSIVESHFRYCCSVWGCAGDTALRKLQNLQNWAARVVTNSPFDHASLPLISKLGWLTVNEMIDFETACMVYKALHGLAPPYMKSMFQSCPSLAIGLYVIQALTSGFLCVKPQMGSEAFRIEGLLFGIN